MRAQVVFNNSRIGELVLLPRDRNEDLLERRLHRRQTCDVKPTNCASRTAQKKRTLGSCSWARGTTYLADRIVGDRKLVADFLDATRGDSTTSKYTRKLAGGAAHGLQRSQASQTGSRNPRALLAYPANISDSSRSPRGMWYLRRPEWNSSICASGNFYTSAGGARTCTWSEDVKRSRQAQALTCSTNSFARAMSPVVASSRWYLRRGSGE